MRDGSLELRHEQLVHKSSARADRTLDKIGPVFARRAHVAEEAGRGGRNIASESSGRKVDNSDAGTS